MEKQLLYDFLGTMSAEIIGRGKRIFLNTNKVAQIEQGDGSSKFLVDSEGNTSTRYTVVLELKNGNVTAKCNCAYYKQNGDPCKHISGVVQHLLNNSKGKAEIVYSPIQNVESLIFNSQNIVLPLEPITRAFVEKYSNAENIKKVNRNFEFFGGGARLEQAWQGEISGEVYENGTYQQRYKVSVKAANNHLYLSCTCKQTNVALCIHKHTFFAIHYKGI